MDGHNLALWRESGEWWLGEPYREFRRFIDSKGIRREEASQCGLPISNSGLSSPIPNPQSAIPNPQSPISEEYALRERKIRDEKVSAACGKLPRSYYERAARERHGGMWKGVGDQGTRDQGIKGSRESGYVPLHVLSGYAFGRSVILAQEIAQFAALVGCPAAAIADPFSLIGAVEHDRTCRQHGVKPLIGSSIELPEGGSIVLIARTKDGYRNLSRLITECHLGEPRCYPLGSWDRLEKYASDLICLTGGEVGPLDRLLVRRDIVSARSLLDRLAGIFGRDNVILEVERSFLPWGMTVDRQILELASETGITAVAGGMITHGRPEHFPAQDVIVCAETLCLIEDVIGRKPPRDESQPSAPQFPLRSLNSERFLRTSDEMAELYRDRPDLLANTFRVAERCEDRVLPERTQVPSLFPDDGRALREIVEIGAFTAYGKPSTKHRKRLEFEVSRIVRLGYASHFLIAWDVCRWAREQSIQMSGRGSVVDSAVAYVLGLSRIDAIAHKLHFDRFLPADNSKRPDIDIDFEAHRRDDVRGYMVRKYGIERTAAVCAVGAYCSRGIVREVGKVMGLPEETISFLSKKIHGGISPNHLEEALRDRPELRDSNIPKEKFSWVFRLAEQLMDVPRNIRTHSSGVVVSDRPIAETVPVMWSATPFEDSENPHPQLRMIQWDKRSCKYFFDKFDILCLRGQDVLGGVESRIRASSPDFSVEQVKATTDPEVYRAMRSGELIGIPQSASPAMRQAHVRLKTNDLHDASLVQAGIRPGVGGAVKLNELIARRRGKPFTFEHPDMEEILGHTYGIIVFQEQVDQILQRFCHYTGGEAEDIRDTIHKRRREDMKMSLREAIIDRVISNGYSADVADTVLELVCGFKGYGFAQGHALAFAEVSLRSVWCMQNHPAEYFAALFSAQPAGYYGPCTLANEARARGVRMLSPDVNRSGKEFTVEDCRLSEPPFLIIPNGAIRVGLMQIANVSKEVKERIIAFQQEWVSDRAPQRHERLPLPSIGSRHSALAVAELEEDCGKASVTKKATYRSLPGVRCFSTAQTQVALAAAGPINPVEGCFRSTTHTGQLEVLRVFGGFFDFVAKIKPSRDELEILILCGALDSLCPNRRAMLWAIPDAMRVREQCSIAALQQCCNAGSVLPGLDLPWPPLDLSIPDFTHREKVIHERATLGMDVETHMVSFEREYAASKGAITGMEAKRLPAGSRAIVVGNPIRLRFPPTPSGRRVVFFDLEDETGMLNVTCFDEAYRRDGRAIVCSPYVTVVGEVQDRDGYPAFLAHRIFEYKPRLFKDSIETPPMKTADFLVG